MRSPRVCRTGHEREGDYAFDKMLSRYGRLRADKKRSRQTSCLVGGLQPPDTEGLMRSLVTLTRTYWACKECDESCAGVRRRSLKRSSFVKRILRPREFSACERRDTHDAIRQPASTATSKVPDGTVPPSGEPVRRSRDNGASWLPYGSRRRRKCIHLW